MSLSGLPQSPALSRPELLSDRLAASSQAAQPAAPAEAQPAAASRDRVLPTQAPKRGAIQAVIALWQPEPPVTAEDKAWAVDLIAATRRGKQPDVDEMARYRRVAKAAPETMPAAYSLAELGPVMQGLFRRIDSDGNGFLGDRELKNALRSPAYKGREAVALATLHKLNHSIEKLSWNEWKQTSGVHAKDLASLSRKAAQDKPSRWTLYVESFVFDQSVRLRQSDARLFPQGLASIRPDHVRQGDYGTCTLLAAASALAATPKGKQAIFEMIREQADGSFEVRFPGEAPLRVKRPTDAELILYASSGSDGIWLSVLEKAFVTKMEQTHAGKGREAAETAVNGGQYLSEGIRLLTGKPATDGTVPDTPLSQLRAFVAERVAAGQLLLATLDPDSAQAKGKALKEKTTRGESLYADGLVGLHAYSVIGYDAATDRIQLHNPWGHTEYGSQGKAADGVDDGIFSLPLEAFHKLFSHISWQNA